MNIRNSKVFNTIIRIPIVKEYKDNTKYYRYMQKNVNNSKFKVKNK